MNRLAREEYVARMRKQLADQKADIKKLNARAKAASREIKARMAQDVKKLRERLQALEKRLAQKFKKSVR